MGSRRCRNYTASDALTIPAGTLAGLGAQTAGGTDLTFTVGTVHTNAEAGNLIAAAKMADPAGVTLNGGNEAVFYWDIKLFGYSA